MSTLDLLGWLGGGLGAVAYVLVSTGRLAPTATSFQGLNMVGAALLGMAAVKHGAVSNAVMNIAWIGFGAQALIAGRVRRQRNLIAGSTPGSSTKASSTRTLCARARTRRERPAHCLGQGIGLGLRSAPFHKRGSARRGTPAGPACRPRHLASPGLSTTHRAGLLSD